MWHQQRIGDPLTVSRFVEEVSLWEKEGFVDDNVWKPMEPLLNPEVLAEVQGFKGAQTEGPDLNLKSKRYYQKII